MKRFLIDFVLLPILACTLGVLLAIFIFGKG